MSGAGLRAATDDDDDPFTNQRLTPPPEDDSSVISLPPLSAYTRSDAPPVVWESEPRSSSGRRERSGLLSNASEDGLRVSSESGSPGGSRRGSTPPPPPEPPVSRAQVAVIGLACFCTFGMVRSSRRNPDQKLERSPGPRRTLTLTLTLPLTREVWSSESRASTPSSTPRATGARSATRPRRACARGTAPSAARRSSCATRSSRPVLTCNAMECRSQRVPQPHRMHGVTGINRTTTLSLATYGPWGVLT